MSYYDRTRNWGFENLEFLKLTLLVGASGVGKTQILRAIDTIKKITNGGSFNGVKWDITFESNDGSTYHWAGEFEEKTLNPLKEMNESEEKPSIVNEKLISGENVIIERGKNNILFQGKETVKLAPYQSCLFLLKAEPAIKEIQNEFSKISVVEDTEKDMAIYITKNAIKSTTLIYENTDKLINSGFEVKYKLLLSYLAKDKSLFESIKQRFIDIFPQIEDIKLVTLKFTDSIDKNTVDFKEKGVKKWISSEDMSSGMLRSFMQICEIYLSPEGSVLLMDEFENSLGVNCIDELTNDILSSKRNIQFILTSHHPYIINNIPYQNWKIVTRKAGKVTVKDASDYRIGESKHDYFMQLLQLDDFNNGVD